MSEFHELSCTPSPAGLVFSCLDGCGRRIVVERATGAMTVIDRGEASAQHRGSHSDLTLAAPTFAGSGAHGGPAAP